MPENLKPELYELQIQPYIGTNETYGDKAFTFEGIMNMHFKCENSTNKIVFHINELEIEHLEISSADAPTISLDSDFQEDYVRQFVIVKMSRNCVEGAMYKLKIEYTGPISRYLYGFYRSSYLDSTGKRH